MSFQQPCPCCSIQIDNSCSSFSELQEHQPLCVATTGINNSSGSLNYLSSTNQISHDMLPYIQKSIPLYYDDDSNNTEGLDWELFTLDELDYFLNGLRKLYHSQLEELRNAYEAEKLEIIEEIKRRDIIIKTNANGQ